VTSALLPAVMAAGVFDAGIVTCFAPEQNCALLAISGAVDRRVTIMGAAGVLGALR
jgi:hypothetical protein